MYDIYIIIYDPDTVFCMQFHEVMQACAANLDLWPSTKLQRISATDSPIHLCRRLDTQLWKQMVEVHLSWSSIRNLSILIQLVFLCGDSHRVVSRCVVPWASGETFLGLVRHRIELCKLSCTDIEYIEYILQIFFKRFWNKCHELTPAVAQASETGLGAAKGFRVCSIIRLGHHGFQWICATNVYGITCRC